MKTQILVFLLTIFTISVSAQSKNSLVFSNNLMKYQKMERAGTALTIIGGLALFTGNIMYWKAYNNDGNNEPAEDKLNTSRYFMIGGFGLMATGIPLWAIGRTKENHIKIAAELVNFKGLAFANGIGIKIRF